MSDILDEIIEERNAFELKCAEIEKKLSEIKEIIESNDSDLVGSLYRIKIILDMID